MLFRNTNRISKSELNSSWRQMKYCAIDLETTGLELRTDEIVSIGAVQIREGRVYAPENYYQEVRPKSMPSPSSIVIHGIRAVDLENAPPITEVFAEFAEHLRGRVIVAHAAWVESAFLQEHLESMNLDITRRTIDTASLARVSGAAEVNLEHEPSLEHLAKSLKLPAYSPHHALGDALTTAVVFLALATELERQKLEQGKKLLTLRELLKLSGRSARAQW